MQRQKELNCLLLMILPLDFYFFLCIVKGKNWWLFNHRYFLSQVCPSFFLLFLLSLYLSAQIPSSSSFVDWTLLFPFFLSSGKKIKKLNGHPRLVHQERSQDSEFKLVQPTYSSSNPCALLPLIIHIPIWNLLLLLCISPPWISISHTRKHENQCTNNRV